MAVLNYIIVIIGEGAILREIGYFFVNFFFREYGKTMILLRKVIL